MRAPTFTQERELLAMGYTPIGIDEAGCGCLAGPVVAAAIHLPMDSRLSAIRDSKLLSNAQRERMSEELSARGYRFATGIASVEEIDRVNIRRATFLAMRRAVEALLAGEHPNDAHPFALVDAWTIPDFSIPQRAIVHGDRLVKSIAAASIIAKVARDRMMRALDAEFPGYGLAQHKGYATLEHRNAINARGLTPYHRRTFCGTEASATVSEM